MDTILMDILAVGCWALVIGAGLWLWEKYG